MEIPESMRAELGAWNGGAGIDLRGWIGCEGRFSLAVGYLTVFWPRFVLFEDYVLVEGFHEDQVRVFAAGKGSTRQSVEGVLNHVHIADLHYVDCADVSRDKIIALGSALKEMYQAKLKWQFPDRAFTVEFYQPEDPDDLQQYQVSFWQSDAP